MLILEEEEPTEEPESLPELPQKRFNAASILAVVGVVSVISLTIVPAFLLASGTPVPATSTAVLPPMTVVEEHHASFKEFASNVALTVHHLQADLSARLATVNRANAVALVKLAASNLPDRNTLQGTWKAVRGTEDIPLKLFWALGIMIFAAIFISAAKSLQKTNGTPSGNHTENIETLLGQLDAVFQAREEQRSAAMAGVIQSTVVSVENETSQNGTPTPKNAGEEAAPAQNEGEVSVGSDVASGDAGDAHRVTPRDIILSTPRVNEERLQVEDETPALVDAATTASPGLGQRASLKTPSARAPSHPKVPRTVDSDTSPSSYPLAKGAGTQRRAPNSPGSGAVLVASPTDATVKAVFGEESPNSHYTIDDLSQEIKATTALAKSVKMTTAQMGKGQGQGIQRTKLRLFQ